ncbi:MAG TPA: quinolinate synthase NadA, partial [Terriglobales bacterium]|nr:quinolinate synthase NadA [Terriglobales bacterium]
DAADVTGDSLELSRKAAGLEAEVIIFCGVRFMAETAAVLAPLKTVLLPEPAAGCPMADMITARELRMWKERYPGRKVVCYVNTSAEVKAESDVCCTSSNAVAVVESLGEEEVLFVPDKNLAAYVARETGRRVVAWDGYCYVHDKFRPEDIRAARAAHPGAEVWVHPECPLDVIDLADRVLSTGKMAAEARVTPARDVIVGTEKGIVHRLTKENPAVRFHPARESALCVNMKMTTLEKVLAALEGKVPPVTVAPDVAGRARGAIEAMLRIT